MSPSLMGESKRWGVWVMGVGVVVGVKFVGVKPEKYISQSLTHASSVNDHTYTRGLALAQKEKDTNNNS